MARRIDPRIWAAAAGGAVGVGLISYGVFSLFSSPGLPEGVVPPRPSDAPFAPVPRGVTWPVLTSDSRRGQVGYIDVNGNGHGRVARAFGADRSGHTHAGVDLFGDYGDAVVAISDGTIVNTQSFHLGSHAVLVDHGDFVALYGEVEPGSWDEFGVDEGSRVRAGQGIARLACMDWDGNVCDSHMLHFETYRPGTTQNKSWTGSPPPELLDPTYLLLVAGGPGVNA